MSHSYGQLRVEEPIENLAFLHSRQGGLLKEVDHEPKMGVLEQENFGAQGIDTSAVVPGAPKVDALGNCVLNSGTVALSNVLSEAAFLIATGVTNYEDTVGGEKFAIRSYHGCTDQTGKTSEEWPPTDCGSSGIYLAEYFQSLKLISGQKIAHGADDLISLLQSDGVCEGGPFFNSWEEPDSGGFIDGDGGPSSLQRAIASGVAGGHERYQSAIVKLTLSATGKIETRKTVLRVRNSWGKSWGDNGSFLVHLSTYVALGRYMDFRQLIA